MKHKLIISRGRAEEISIVQSMLAAADPALYGKDMILGKPRPKISWSNRRIRLAVAHHGAPSAWTAPVKDRPAADRTKPSKKR